MDKFPAPTVTTLFAKFVALAEPDNNRFDASKFIYTYHDLRLDAGYLSDGTPVVGNVQLVCTNGMNVNKKGA